MIWLEELHHIEARLARFGLAIVTRAQAEMVADVGRRYARLAEEDPRRAEPGEVSLLQPRDFIRAKAKGASR